MSKYRANPTFPHQRVLQNTPSYLPSIFASFEPPGLYSMSWLASFALYVFHAIYYVANFISSIRRHFTNAPRPLDAQRKQVPSHLALVLASDENGPTEGLEECMLDNVEEVVSWCRAAGIRKLTVYDRRGESSSHSIYHQGKKRNKEGEVY